MIVLGIESTCDEMGISVVRNGHEILSNMIASQADFHRQFGGVFPEYASRSHQKQFLPTLEKALEEARVAPEELDLIAFANRPGLMGSLLIGANGAKALAYALNKPLYAVNHVEAHLLAALLPSMQKRPLEELLPAIGLVISGGHTNLYRIDDICHFELLSHTVDDAAGEAFDKVAKMLDLPYPGGPRVEKLAQQGDEAAYPFKAGQIKQHPLHFSFSGIKTSVLYTLKKSKPQDHADIAASFQKAVCDDVVKKTLKAAKSERINHLIIGGGVALNQTLRQTFQAAAPTDLRISYPEPTLCQDNGAMIAALASARYTQNPQTTPLDCEVFPRITSKTL